MLLDELADRGVTGSGLDPNVLQAEIEALLEDSECSSRRDDDVDDDGGLR
jgi:hypothetical protein